MAKKIKHKLGIIYDCPAKWVLGLILKVFHISLNPSPSRWGFIAIFFALGFFFLSLFFTMPIPIDRGDRIWLLWLGIASAVIVFYIGGYFLRHQGRDPSSKQLTGIDEKLAKTNKELAGIKRLLEKLIERLDKYPDN